MRTNVGACRTHEGGSGTNKSAQELTLKDRKTARSSLTDIIASRWFNLKLEEECTI